jgi:hypothetical protein
VTFALGGNALRPPGAPMAYNGYRVRLIERQVPGSIPGHIGLIIRGSLPVYAPSNGAVSRGSLCLVSMQEQVKHE